MRTLPLVLAAVGSVGAANAHAATELRIGTTASAKNDVTGLLGSARRMLKHLDRLTAEPVHAAKTRYHGDYHLGQVLLTAHDFVIAESRKTPMHVGGMHLYSPPDGAGRSGAPGRGRASWTRVSRRAR